MITQEPKPSLTKDGAPLAEPAPAIRYVAYPKAMQQLTARLGATPEELAAWIFMVRNLAESPRM